jgi:hypothetical protein
MGMRIAGGGRDVKCRLANPTIEHDEAKIVAIDPTELAVGSTKQYPVLRRSEVATKIKIRPQLEG